MKRLILLSIYLLSTLFCSAQQNIDGFENFHNYTALNPFVTLQAPNGWSGSDSLIVTFGFIGNPFGTFQSQIKKVSGSAGTGALQVNTKQQDSFLFFPPGPIMAACFNSKFSVDINTGNFTFNGGYPMTGRPESMQYTYQTVCKGGDSTSVTAVLLDTSGGIENVIAAAAMSYGSDVNTFTPQTVNFEYIFGTENLTPDLLRFTVATAGSTFDFANLASTIFHDSTSITIDELKLTYPLGINETVLSSKMVTVKNNPCQDNLDLVLNTDETCSIALVNAGGQSVYTQALTRGENNLNISHLSAGTYVVNVLNGKSQIVHQQKLLKN